MNLFHFIESQGFHNSNKKVIWESL